jgi:hypothetical protein
LDKENKMGTNTYSLPEVADDPTDRKIKIKENRKKMKWARHIPHALVQEVLSLNPEKVEFVVVPKKYIICTIKTKDGKLAQGISIYSTSEHYFDEIKGKDKSLGLAVGAIKRGYNRFPIRSKFSDFPGTWTKKQMERVMELANIFEYRSIYRDCIN